MITLFDNWVVFVDERNFTLAEYFGEKKSKDGKTKKNIKTYGYFSGLSEALAALRVILIRRELSSGSRTLSEALRTIREEDQRIDRLLEGIEV